MDGHGLPLPPTPGEAQTSRFPKHLQPDIHIQEVDLDVEEVQFRGEPLTEARAEGVAVEILERMSRTQTDQRDFT